MQSFNLSFSDTKAAFRHKSDYELKKSKFIFSVFKYALLVKYGPGLATLSLKIGLPIKGFIKKTFFGQFCGGETIDDCDLAVKSLWESRVGAILDYSVEGHETEENFDANVEEIKKTILKANHKPEYPFCVFKPTGVGRFALLEKVDAGTKLEMEELEEFYRIKKRMESICQTAYDNDVRLFIDAEESWIQNSVDDIVNEMMAKYNTQKAIVFNTIQLYRKGRVDYISKCIEEANGYYLGFKLVRGAYMEKEAERALQLNYNNPIQDDKASCDKDYNSALKLCFDHKDKVSICAGTHNEESSFLLAKWMHEEGLEKNDSRFWFAQLYGMSDNISFNLAANGYNVAKYLPYGPVISVMPYLGRRAKENSSMQGQVGRELRLIVEEIKRRKQNKN
jgi:proline dehydrogenase